MRKSRFTEEQIIATLAEQERGGHITKQKPREKVVREKGH